MRMHCIFLQIEKKIKSIKLKCLRELIVLVFLQNNISIVYCIKKHIDEHKNNRKKLFLIHISFLNQAARNIRRYILYGFASDLFEFPRLKFFDKKS